MKKSVRKGQRGAAEVAQLLRAVYPECRHRVNGEERQDAVQGRDIEGTPGLCVQVNISRYPRPMEKLREATSAAKSGEIAVAITRLCSTDDKGEPWLATLDATAFAELLKKALAYDETDEGSSAAILKSGKCPCGALIPAKNLKAEIPWCAACEEALPDSQ